MSSMSCFFFDPGCKRKTHPHAFCLAGRHGGGFGSRFGPDQYRHRNRTHVGGIGSAYVYSIHFHRSALNHEEEVLTLHHYLRLQRLEKNGQVANRPEDVDTDVPDRAGS